MREHVQMVREFHERHGFPVGVPIGSDPRTDMVRIHLIAEEGVAELALAIAERDRVKVADALADLAYVLFGTAVTYGIPLQEVFEEVHRSNMTKAVRRPGDTRLRDKGASYVPADVAGVLESADDAVVDKRSYNVLGFTFMVAFTNQQARQLYRSRLTEMVDRSEVSSGDPRRRCLEIDKLEDADGFDDEYVWGLLVGGSYGAVGSNKMQAARVAMLDMGWRRNDGKDADSPYEFESGEPFRVRKINRSALFMGFTTRYVRSQPC